MKSSIFTAGAIVAALFLLGGTNFAEGLTCFECPAQMSDTGCLFSQTIASLDCNSELTPYPRCLYSPPPDFIASQNVFIDAFKVTETLAPRLNVSDCFDALQDAMNFFLVKHFRMMPVYQCTGAVICGTSVAYDQVVAFIQTACPVPDYQVTWDALKALDSAVKFECCNSNGCNTGPPDPCPAH